jgi:hypothetical protein
MLTAAMKRLTALFALIALVVAGCGPASAPTNAIVTVINLSAVTGTFRWDSSDAQYGIRGTEPMRGCAIYARGFFKGTYQITVRSATHEHSFSFVAPDPTRGEHFVWLVIEGDGQIRETTESAAPTPPYCASSPASGAVTRF